MAYWTVKQLAQEMGLQERTIIQRIHKGEIEAEKLGGKGKWLIPSSEIDRLLGRHKVREDLVNIAPLVFEQNIRAHTESVLNLLDAYARQLKIPYDPEAPFILNSIVVYPPRLILEKEPSFAAVEGHYKHTKLGEDVIKYKQAVDAYHSTVFKLQGAVVTQGCLVRDATVSLELLRKVVRIKLAPVRIELYLRGIETDQTILERSSEVLKSIGQSGTLLQQLLEFVGRYKDEEGEVIIELLGSLQKNYEIMKRLENAIIRDVEEEKLRGILPPGTKCKFCPPAIIEEADSTIRGGAS